MDVQKHGNEKYPENLKPPFKDIGAGPPPGLESNMDPQPRYKNPRYKGSDKLKDKVAFVTGGDSGIGRSIVYHYAKEGADIFFVCLPSEIKDALRVKAEVEELGRECHFAEADLTSYEECQRVTELFRDQYQNLHILVNNAAYQKHIYDLEELSIANWDLTFKTNIYSYFYMVKCLDSLFFEPSAIINIGSVTGLEGSQALLDYSSTKGAIHAFTKSLAKYYLEKKRNIRVNGIAPGPVWTPLNPAELSPQEAKKFGQDSPLGRPAQPEEIAPCAVFLASDIDSSYLTGEIIPILGGDI